MIPASYFPHVIRVDQVIVVKILKMPLSKDAVLQMRISEATRKSYAGKMKIITQWIIEKYPTMTEVVNNTTRIDLTKLTIDVFLDFLGHRTITDRNDILLAYSTVSGFKSALVCEYHEQKKPLPTGWEEAMNAYFAGVKRLDAQARLDGHHKKAA